MNPADRSLLTALEATLGRSLAVAASAPGRVNLIGDHIDYCGGTVLPMAIDRRCVAAIAPDAGPAGRCLLTSLSSTDTLEIPADRPIQPPAEGSAVRWTDYAAGVIAELQQLAPIERLGGCRIAVVSDVPLGAGLSSSAALEVSVAAAVAAWLDIELAPLELARLCQRAEHRFPRVPCGLMDQAAACLCRPGCALALDCASEHAAHAPIPGHAAITVINTSVCHSLADGEYAQRRNACTEAARALGVQHLALADANTLDALDAELRPIARHAITENQRVHSFARALAADDLARAGELMNESHQSLRDDFRVSCAELDTLCDALANHPGVHGVRVTGGGFGGCAVALHEPDRDQDIEAIAKRLRAHQPIRCVPSEGAEVIVGNTP